MSLYFGAGNLNMHKKNSRGSICKSSGVNGVVVSCPIPDKQSIIKSSNNNDSQTQNERIATLITSSLGGRIQYGNFTNKEQLEIYLKTYPNNNFPVQTIKPLKNKF